VRVRVFEDYAAGEVIASAHVLMTYTCDVIPSEAECQALRAFLGKGGRWFALHGTNSALVLEDGKPVSCPPLPPTFRQMIGSQFMAHPPMGRFKVTNAAPGHPLVAGIGSFFVEDEHYLQEHEEGNEVLLATRFAGRTELFERVEWPDGEHQVMYLRRSFGGEVLYLSLGHARGRFDMRPLADRYPFVERGAWVHPVYRELLRRGIRWAMKEDAAA
jgi:type 1 glutamine amidotransferase